MIKNKFILFALTGSLVCGGMFTSCEDFLSEIPDNRTEIDSPDKAKELLVNAYIPTNINMIGEMSSDNVDDNGPKYTTIDRMINEAYAWEKITTQTQDSPYALWNYAYTAIAAANYALDYLKENNDESVMPYRGEAYICRAYAHFMLANVFCQHYKEGSQELGIPYIDRSDYGIMDVPERHTISYVYDMIAKDIEAGLPLIRDNAYASNVLKYHFNVKAANAFAARFYLYYGKYDKAIACATAALGSDPSANLRDYEKFKSVSSAEDIAKMYVRSDEPANLLLLPLHSIWPYNLMYGGICRYVHTQKKSETSTILAPGPWVDKGNFCYATLSYGAEEINFFPKYTFMWEITDVVAQSGYPHIVYTAFTTDETLLTRAEAYALSEDFEKSAKDLQMWYDSHTGEEAPAFDQNRLEQFFEEGSVSKDMCPTLNPDFTITDQQRAYLNCVLYFRRCETLHEGVRWLDVKRYGIEVQHGIFEDKPMILTKEDPRRAVQLPDAVLGTGMTPNPR